MKPYYDKDGITIYCGDCRDVLPTLPKCDLLLTDPPYGIGYTSNREGDVPRMIRGDTNSTLRDYVLTTSVELGIPAAYFATWRCIPPIQPRGQLIWNKNDHCGMGDLSFPWKTDYEVIWIYGDGWRGHRGTSILTGETIPS